MDFENEGQKNATRCEIGRAVLRLPSSLHHPYAMAVMVAPQLVMTESDPLSFLPHAAAAAAEKDIHGAASQLALYWRMRHSCYGERAFLPMDSTGTGTLTHQDICSLRESCMMRLPNDDRSQAAAYIINTATISSSLTPSGIRALFYQLHLSAAKVTSGRVVFLVVASDEKNHPSTTTCTSLADLQAFFNLLAEFACKALPLKVARVHIISSPLMTPAHCACVKRIVENSLSPEEVVVDAYETSHYSSPNQLFTPFQPFGLTSQGFPSVVSLEGKPEGGMTQGVSSLDPAHCQQDGSYHLHAPPAHGNHGFTSAAILDIESVVSGIQDDGDALLALTLKRRNPHADQEDHAASTKIKAHSSSPAKKPTAFNHQGSTQSSEETGMVLSNPQIKNAVDDVDDADAKEAEEIRLKKRNALYSRRKYERKKVEIEVMKKEARRHKIQNGRLLEEQQRLEQLLAQAMKCIDKHEKRGLLNPSGSTTTLVDQEDSADFI
jgi:hypothetical protein